MARHTTFAFVIVCASFFLFSHAPFVHAASKTSAEVINDGAKNSGCDYDPYQKLISMGIVRSGVQIEPKNRQGGIDVSLACRLTKLFEAAGKCAQITSGYRSPELQKSMCGAGRVGCAPAGGSCHQYGLAVDISGPCLEKMAQLAPKFQLVRINIPKDPYHFQCAEHPHPGRSPQGERGAGCSTPCNGGIAITGVGPGNPPSSPFTNALRDALGLDKQPTPQQAAPTPQQALPQQQQPTQYFPSSGTGQQTPTSGTSGQSPVSALSPASQQYLGVTQSDTQPQVSIADQLLQMAYGTTSTQQPQNTGTTVPVHLTSNDIGTVQSNPTPVMQVGTQPTQKVPVGSLQPGQTFTSPDLGYAPSVPQTYPTEPTGVFRVLETMKSVLLRMLEILRPMGIRNALEGVGTYVDEHAE